MTRIFDAAAARAPAVLLALSLVLGCAARQRAQPAVGMVISRSTEFANGVYRLPAPEDSDEPVIRVRNGQNVTVDFRGAVLDGAARSATPDQFRGTAVHIEGGRNVTLKNLTARGYKVAVHARNVERLRLVNCDLSYNYRQRLRSTLEREDLSDWMSYHQNDADEWLRYGAAIYLNDCDAAEVTRCRVTGGQNGLMMTRCDDGRVWNNDFSFNSGVGVGMYRSSRNRVMRNRLDWNVRGYSHGVYHRGQDSAAILVYEQSCDNTFAYNSATHSGDGFFLWAGQTTMDTGKGGCNDNVIACNDFSFAPTNGIEVTFSRNLIHSNTIEGCDHGIWGGYSYETRILQNTFRNNRVGIAIEHGSDNLIAHNSFDGDKTAIKLWQNAKQDPNWGYPKFRDTRSRGYGIFGNNFKDVGRESDITGTSEVQVSTTAPSSVPVIDLASPLVPQPIDPALLHPFPSGQLPRGREYILVDEWGPYDFRSPTLWPREKLADGRQRFEVLGPPGKWRLVSRRGVASVSAEAGQVPGELVIGYEPGKVVDVDVRLEYTGSAVTSPLGEKFTAGEAVPFGFHKFVAPIDWTVRWFRYDERTEPREHYDAFKKLLDSEPLKQEKTTDLAYAWYGAVGKEPGLPSDRFATLAEGAVEVPPGEYRIEVTSDDGVRVWLDGRVVIDNWTWHVPTTDTAVVRLGGAHRLRVEHFEIDGFATLALRLVPARAPSRGK